MPRSPSPSNAAPASAPGWSRHLFAWALCGMVILGAGGWLFADWYSTVPADTHATYVGRQSCVSCHQQESKLYAGSHHDRAMEVASQESVLGDFSGVEFEHDGIRSTMYKDGDRFMVRTEGPDGALADFEVKYTLGVSPLQNYMVEFDRSDDMTDDEVSRLQVLRITWDTLAKKWFYLPPPDVHDKLSPDDDLHWCGITQRWNTSCADCHSTNVKKNFDEATLRYRTTFSEIDVSCEACHGPGSTHVQLANSFSFFWDRKVGYGLTTNLKAESNENQVQVCAECHARRQVLADDYDPGDNYWDHYSTELLSRLVYQADGQIEDEVFEHGSFLQSKMYHKSIRCTDCHDPHTAKLKHEGNQLCTSCHQHPAGKYDTPLHHHHQMGTKGASCVECHMPITNYMEVHGRRDHSLRVPRPDISVDLGTSNACTACHLDQQKLNNQVRAAGGKTNADHLKQYLHYIMAARSGDEVIKQELARVDKWAAEACQKWYGSKTPPPGAIGHYAYALDAARRNDPQAEKLLAEVVRYRTFPAIVRATALTEWGRFGSDAMIEGSEKQLDDRHPLVRAAAAANLLGLSPAARARLLGPLLEDPDFVVRRTAARALADAGMLLNGKQRNLLQLTLNEWIQGLMANNDRAGAHLAVGDLQLQLRDVQAAEAAYRQAIRVEPSALGARGQLAALLEALAADGVIPPEQHKSVRTEVLALRADELALLKRDAERAPDLAVVQFLYGREVLATDMSAGLTALAKAVELEPTVIEYRLVYAQALLLADKRPEARQQLERVLEQQPDNVAAKQLLQEL